MKRLFLLSFLLMAFVSAYAQNISVKSFQALPMDLTASSKEGKRIDQNGQVAALIKVVTTETGFTFEGGTLGVVDTKQRNGEVWVWVPRGLRKITVLHQRLGVLRDYVFPVEIEAERTYEMVLTTAKVKTVVEDEVREQYLIFQITPPDAMLEVDDQAWTVSAEGTAKKLVKFGTYTYRVQALNYHADAGSVTVDDPNDSKMVSVTLLPNYGWIEVSGEGNLQGAAVYIDNTLAGKAPFKSEALKSGQHQLKIVKDMYAPYSTTVTVNDNATTKVKPELTANFAHVTLKVDADAEIWVNDERKGVRTWTGDLANGAYKMECKQASHETSVTRMEITSQMNGETINLETPTPIYGSLVVESTPDIATLYIDGKEEGKTPKLIGKLLIGTHELKLTKSGYADYTETVTITKGERTQVTAVLSNGREVQFTCNVPTATLEIDGQRMSSPTGTYMLTYGSHSLRASAADYEEYSNTINVSENTRTYGIAMQPISSVPEGAVDGVFSVGPGTKVYFSKGNLQYQASTGEWRFAERQYDCIGENNKNISSGYSGWIDLFGWGTSGWNSGAKCYQPWSTSTTYSDYYPGGSYTNNLTGSYAKADWGVYNKISNGGNQSGQWRTLTKDEWVYVFNTRTTTSGIRYAKSCVNNVNGVILLPDDWSTSYYSLSNTNNTGASFSSNTITSSQWATLEQHGAVFLPAAGNRGGTSVYRVGSDGFYWSASFDNSGCAYSVWFGDSYLNPQYYSYRYGGLSVRLVRSAQ